jgi:hypothetical protein
LFDDFFGLLMQPTPPVFIVIRRKRMPNIHSIRPKNLLQFHQDRRCCMLGVDLSSDESLAIFIFHLLPETGVSNVVPGLP